MADPNIIVTKTLTQKIRKGFLDIPYFVHEFIEEDTHAEQDQCLRGMRLRPVTTISSGNRWGKGDLIDFYMTWLAVYKPFAEQFKKKEVSILNTSISQDQANIVLDKFKSKILQKPKMQAFVSDVKQSPFPNIIFNSGVTWWFRNASQGGKYLEGRAYAHINFDEADLQDNYAQFIEDIIMPRTWDYAGSISHTTTPRKGKTNAYKVWAAAETAMKTGSADCFSFYGDSRANKFLPQQTIDKFNKLPARLFNKNVLGKFEDSQGSISSQAVDFAATIACNLQQDPDPGHFYVHGWDLARHSTWCVGITLDVTREPYQLVQFDRFKDHSGETREYWQGVIAKIKLRQSLWGGITAIDRTGVGDVVMSFLEDTNAIGYSLQDTLRSQIISEGVSTINLGKIGIPALTQFHEEGSWFSQDELRDFDQECPDNWDFTCALFIAIWLARGNRPGSTKVTNPTVARAAGVSKYAFVNSISVRSGAQRPASRVAVR